MVSGLLGSCNQTSFPMLSTNNLRKRHWQFSSTDSLYNSDNSNNDNSHKKNINCIILIMIIIILIYAFGLSFP